MVPQSMASLEIFSIALVRKLQNYALACVDDTFLYLFCTNKCVLNFQFNFECVPEDGYVLDVVPGNTYLLRVINAGLFSEFYLKIAGHKFTVVAADANYVSPYTTDVIAIAPGETVDALVVANASPGRYYMVALPNQAPLPDTQTPEFTTRGIVQYKVNHSSIANAGDEDPSGDVALAPQMPDHHDTITSFYFHNNLTSLHHPTVPRQVDENLFLVLGLGSICRNGHQFCPRNDPNDSSLTLATINNISFLDPMANMPLLEAQYYHTGLLDVLQELPDEPPRAFNFTDKALIPFGTKEMQLEPSSKATTIRRFKQGAVVDIVFQSSAILQGDSNPMHLHGHDMFLLAEGLGNYDAAKDVERYNLVNPPVKNTVLVPNLGWAAVRFVANNPGA
jgi:laccase